MDHDLLLLRGGDRYQKRASRRGTEGEGGMEGATLRPRDPDAGRVSKTNQAADRCLAPDRGTGRTSTAGTARAHRSDCGSGTAIRRPRLGHDCAPGDRTRSLLKRNHHSHSAAHSQYGARESAQADRPRLGSCDAHRRAGGRHSKRSERTPAPRIRVSPSWRHRQWKNRSLPPGTLRVPGARSRCHRVGA